ncbi:BadF/BadG/BcrA/BcrD ATPase family protein, partial [Nocardioides sp. NPDC000441]|uniref:BadF/BadG/BcrA/BcrD ATPase family protein n=1 Tax=Nocardioides sp. NPDC000441 TaxID=3154256 RepID=UPI00332FE0DC
MNDNYLGLDAGGTSTRAVVVTSDGRCTGIGKAGSGNPTSAGVDAATTAIRAAVTQAVTSANAGQLVRNYTALQTPGFDPPLPVPATTALMTSLAVAV